MKKNHHDHAPSLEQALAALKKSGLKLTAPRKAILKALAAQHGPFTVEQIYKLITRRVCDQATVYRNLGPFDRGGLGAPLRIWRRQLAF